MKPTEREILRRLQKARHAYLNRDYQKALQEYHWVAEQIQDDPDNLPIIWIEIGWSYYYNKDYPKSIEYLKRAVDSGKLQEQQIYDCLRLIGFAYGSLQQFKEALDYLNRAREFSVSESDKRYIYFELGKIYFLQGNIKEAEPHLQKAWELFRIEERDYKLALAYYLGFVHFFKRDFNEARKCFNQIIQMGETDRERAPGYFGLAHLAYEEKEYPLLIDLCEKIVQLDPDFYDKETLAYFLCTGFMHLKMWDELDDFFQEMKANYPNGRYRISYPVFEKALRNRQIPEPEDRNHNQKNGNAKNRSN
ncbi:MAG: tetratricopeptide repeat protein [Calditrichaeota bacterium]|nr:tetratricopeptide repeat protein [Calditrichota bacterium]